MTSSVPSSVLLFGATGTIGRYITEAVLNARPAFGRITLFTSPATAGSKAELLEAWKAKGIRVVVGDVTNPGDVASVYETEKIDTVVSCLGRGALQTQIELLRVAEGLGTVKWFFPSEYGTDVEYGPNSREEKPHQNKLAVRKYIRENVKNMKVTYLVTGPYFDMWVNRGAVDSLGFFDVGKKEAVIEAGNGRIGFCTMVDVGKSLVAALRHPEQSYGRALKVQSFVVTPKEVLDEYQRQTGAEWAVSYTSLERLKEVESQLWADGVPAATGATLRRIWAEGGTLYERNDNELLGLAGELESLETAVRRAITEARERQ